MRRHGVRPPRCAGCTGPGVPRGVCCGGLWGCNLHPHTRCNSQLTQSHSVTPTQSRRTRWTPTRTTVPEVPLAVPLLRHWRTGSAK